MEYVQKKRSPAKTMLLLLFSAILIGVFLLGIGRISIVSREKTRENIENAIVQASVHCYAVEGMYPESLDYLKEHYGISYDEKKYVVKYEVIAQNLRPQIHVIPME